MVYNNSAFFLQDRVYTVNELKGNIAMVDDTIDRRAHDPPAVIRFEIFEAKEIYEAVWERDDNVGQLEIQTQTEDNPVLSKLVEKCIRKQMERNDTDCIFDLSINFLYKNRDLCWDGLLDSYEMRLNREELEMVRNRGRKVAQMKLGLGDVAVGFTMVSKRGGVLTNKLDSMFLLFGEESVKQYSKHRHNSSELRRCIIRLHRFLSHSLIIQPSEAGNEADEVMRENSLAVVHL